MERWSVQRNTFCQFKKLSGRQTIIDCPSKKLNTLWTLLSGTKGCNMPSDRTACYLVPKKCNCVGSSFLGMRVSGLWLPKNPHVLDQVYSDQKVHMCIFNEFSKQQKVWALTGPKKPKCLNGIYRVKNVSSILLQKIEVKRFCNLHNPGIDFGWKSLCKSW